jgi:hypothetical protein
MTDTPDAMKHAIDALISEAPVALPEPIDARLPVRVVARHPTDRTQVLVEYTFPTPEGSHPWPTATFTAHADDVGMDSGPVPPEPDPNPGNDPAPEDG